jgi:hypothetical protein
VSEQDLRNPNFIEVVKRNQEYAERYGRYLGGFLYLVTLRASLPPRSVWKLLIATLGAVSVALITAKVDWLAWMRMVWP